jgi:hypothetical protein
MHYSQKKEKNIETVPLNGIIIFFPWTCETGEEDDFSSFLCHRPQSFKKDADTFKKTPTQPTFHVLKGGGGAAAQWPPQPRLPPLFLPIKTGEGEENKEGREERD